MTELVDSYQRDDVHRYEAILKDNPDLLEDKFIAENIDEVSRTMRTKAVLKLVAPYSRFTLAFIAKHIKIPISEVQDILGVLIVDKKLRAKINQENGTVIVDNVENAEHILRLHDWTNAMSDLWSTALNDGEGYRPDDAPNGAGAFMMPSTFEPPISTGPLRAAGGRLRPAKGGKAGKMSAWA